jgi:hypothetical protein
MTKGFRTFIGLWVLLLLAGFLSLTRTPATPRPQPAKLSPVENCANGLLILDRSIGVIRAFEVCSDPNHAFEAWMAHKGLKRP